MVGLVQLGLGLVGFGANALQGIQAAKAMKQAGQAKAQAQQQLKNIKEFNAFKAVQVPTLGFNLAQESKAQSMAQGVEALKGMGAEGAGNVVGLVQAGFGQDLALAAQADEAKYKRDAMQAEAEQGIQQRQAERDFALESYNLQDAAEKEAQYKQARNKSWYDAINSLGGAALGAYEDSALYKKNQATNFNVGDTASQGQPGYGVLFNQGQQPQQNQWWNSLTNP